MRFFKLALALFFLWGQVDAQGLRDPTVPPAEARVANPATAGQVLTAEPGAMTIIVRDGHPYLAIGTRLYARGQKLGLARIERITETEVWLREDGVLRKVPQFPGIERRSASELSKPGIKQ
jgi:hypothetical protein